jgi:hypothetical protein
MQSVHEVAEEACCTNDLLREVKDAMENAVREAQQTRRSN